MLSISSSVYGWAIGKSCVCISGVLESSAWSEQFCEKCCETGKISPEMHLGIDRPCSAFLKMIFGENLFKRISASTLC